MVGGGFVHGYGNFLDANEQYKLPESRNGANIVKWAEQDFFEHCVGLSAGNSVPSDFDDLINIGMNFEIGWFNSFDNIPGFTVVTTASASVLIFATSASAIECCDTDDYYAADCVRCGTAIGLGIFLPPTWGDVDYSFESCYAYPVSERSNGNFDMSNCQKQDWRMWMECKGGPYHMITIHVISLNKEIPRIRGDICEKYPDEGPYIWRYDFRDPNVQGMVIRNNLPGQTVKIGRFGLRPLEKEWQRRRGVIFQGVTFGSKSGTNFFAGQIYTAPYGHSTTGELTYSQAKIVSQTWKCEKWNFTKEQCCNSKLQENGEGCYWHTAGKKGQCRGLPAPANSTWDSAHYWITPAQTTCEPEQNSTATKLYETGVLDDEALFNDHWSVGAIICRVCPGCASSHEHICYKRLTKPAGAASNGYILFTTNWYNDSNVLNTDFELYSSLEDAKIGSNKWNYCNYNDPGIGFPRDCGPTDAVGGQWNSRNRGGQTVTYWLSKTGDAYQLTISSTSNAEYSFKLGALEKGNVVWNDRNYVFGDVPSQIQGIALLTGPTRVPKGDIITFSGMQAGVFYALLTKSRDGGYKTNLLRLGWTRTFLETSWLFKGKNQFMDILSIENDGTNLVLPAAQTSDAVVVFGWKKKEV